MLKQVILRLPGDQTIATAKVVNPEGDVKESIYGNFTIPPDATEFEEKQDHVQVTVRENSDYANQLWHLYVAKTAGFLPETEIRTVVDTNASSTLPCYRRAMTALPNDWVDRDAAEMKRLFEGNLQSLWMREVVTGGYVAAADLWRELGLAKITPALVVEALQRLCAAGDVLPQEDAEVLPEPVIIPVRVPDQTRLHVQDFFGNVCEGIFPLMTGDALAPYLNDIRDVFRGNVRLIAILDSYMPEGDSDEEDPEDDDACDMNDD